MRLTSVVALPVPFRPGKLRHRNYNISPQPQFNPAVYLSNAPSHKIGGDAATLSMTGKPGDQPQ